MIGMMAVLATINDPGLTIDEPINVGHGKRMVWMLSHTNLTTPIASVADRIEGVWGHAHEHPPLTRFSIGVAHHFLDSDPDDPNSFVPMLGRPASAVAYGIILFLVTIWAWSLGERMAGPLNGPVAGVSAGLLTLALPRLFGHAHFASPEVISAAAILAALMAGGRALDRISTSGSLGKIVSFLWAGLWVGIALLTKLTAVLVPIALTIAFLVRYRFRGLVTLIVIGLVSLAVFIAGWPWLWPISMHFDNNAALGDGWTGTVLRLIDFFKTGVERATIYVGYFGKQFPNESSGVPWHYVWVFFFVTVPVGVHAAAICGIWPLWRMGRDIPSARLLLLQIAIILGFFMLPVGKYDGERLFLMIFPMWTIVAGCGIAWVVDVMSRYVPLTFAVVTATLFIAVQFVGVIGMHPYQLSYYNGAIGGLPGAERLGLEATYWGDTVNDEILDQLAEKANRGDEAVLIPSLYRGHAAYMTNRKLMEKDIVIDSLSEGAVDRDQWAIVFNRSGYLGDPLPRRVMKEGELVAEISRQGVWLTRLYRLPVSRHGGASDSTKNLEH
ncbi:glycosyltransferase family 39 protein [bacterium]|nr:glycosyltransferase family 39 protein [bacterium]